MSGGIVYAKGGATTARYGEPFTLATSGSQIPPGAYFISVGWNILGPPYTGTPPVPTSTTMPAGYCLSDGNATTNAANANLVPIGAKDSPPTWPWPAPWPLT